MRERARFAPSPTGPLHIGGVRTALFNYLIAKKSGGKFILRIEDTDSKRTVDGAEKHIIDSLEWLGLQVDEGPIRQSNRSKLYKKQVDELLKQGNAYYAFDSQEDHDSAREAGGIDFKYNVKTRMTLNNSFTVSEEERKKRVEEGRYVVRLAIPENKKISAYDEIRGELTFDSNETGNDLGYNRLLDYHSVLVSCLHYRKFLRLDYMSYWNLMCLRQPQTKIGK